MFSNVQLDLASIADEDDLDFNLDDEFGDDMGSVSGLGFDLDTIENDFDLGGYGSKTKIMIEDEI